MQTTTPATSPIDDLAQDLFRSISANRYEEAQECIDQLAAFHSAATHNLIMSVLERARNLAITQRGLACSALANLKSANNYSPEDGDQTHYLGSG